MTSRPIPDRTAGTRGLDQRLAFSGPAVQRHPALPENGRPRAARHGPARPNGEARVQLRLVRLSDSVVVLATLLAAFVAANIGRMPNGLPEFLALRVTVKNLVMLALFIVAWRLVGRLTGLYEWRGIRNRGSEIARVVLRLDQVGREILRVARHAQARDDRTRGVQGVQRRALRAGAHCTIRRIPASALARTNSSASWLGTRTPVSR